MRRVAVLAGLVAVRAAAARLQAFAAGIRAVAAAQAEGMAPDAYYAMHLLENTGIVVVPGSGFGQKAGTWHFRTTFLPPEDQIDLVGERMAKFHGEFLAKHA